MDDSSDEAVIATVEDEPILTREFEMHMRDGLIAKTYNHFSIEHDATVDDEFWTTKHGDQKPIDFLRARTLDAAVRSKVTQILLREQGILFEINYDAFLKELQAENERRESTIEAGKRLFGVEGFDENEYYNHVLNNGKLRWKRHVEYGDSELDISLPAESVGGDPVEQKIELVIDRRIRHADVQINDDVYERIWP